MKDIMRRASAYLKNLSVIRARIEPLMRRMSAMSLSAAGLAKLFGVVFLVSLIIQLPASLGMRMLQPQGLYAQSISGSFWDIRLEKFVYAGRQWSSGRFELAALPLLIGRLGGDFSLSGAGGVFNGSIKHAGSDRVAFHRLDGKFSSYFQSTEINAKTIQMPVTVTIEGHKLNLDKTGTCYDGSAMLTLSTDNAIIGSLLPASLLWSGKATCADGVMRFDLTADLTAGAYQTTKIDNIRIAGTLETMRLKADIIVRLPASSYNDDAILNVLRFSGFEARPDGWALPLEGGF
ncbi:MAG: hypothetical protein GWP33_11150 [Alphaproteobacteria bacterium]|nr:hypothetical protein [Alphaproteobacteria bacterium]